MAPPHQQLAGEQQPDTTIEMQLCSFGQIRCKENSMSHEILAKFEIDHMNVNSALMLMNLNSATQTMKVVVLKPLQC